MELHSYAKRRTSKKWTVEQKRKLVEVRIAYDDWFTNKPSSVVPWKNILVAANLDDFNVFFVRKQWSNMLARYKQYKQTRLGVASKAIEADLIKRINQEWEFFEPIHKFMTRKTTNLHSYALTHRADNNSSERQEEIGEAQVLSSSITEVEHFRHSHRQTNKTPTKLLHNETITLPKDCAKENIPNNTTVVIQTKNISHDDGIHVFSSDTNEEFQVVTANTTRVINSAKEKHLGEDEDENRNCVRNTDHDFYSKKFMVNTVKRENEFLEQQSNYFADASEESHGSLNMVVDLQQTNNFSNIGEPLITLNKNQLPTFEIKTENIIRCESVNIKEETYDLDMPSTSTQCNLTQNVENHPYNLTNPQLSERDKYYRHKRRFNRRLEQRFDAILQVMGHIVKTKYPSVDVTPLVGTITSVASGMSKMISSDSEDDNQSDDSNKNIP